MKYDIELDSDLRLSITFLPLRLGLAFDVSVQRGGAWYTRTRAIAIGTLIKKLCVRPEDVAISMIQESVGTEEDLPKGWKKLAGNLPRLKPNNPRVSVE